MRLTIPLLCFTALALVAPQTASMPAWADPMTTPTVTPQPTAPPRPTATANPEQIRCEWKKHKKIGRYEACVQNAVVEKVKNPAFDLDAAKAACVATFETAWMLQDDLAASVMQECLDGPGNFDDVRAMLDAPADRLEAWLEGARWVNNGDGTATDNTTGLQWELKTDDGTLHDKDNTYTWGSVTAPYAANGTAFTDFISRLNASADGVCFAAHCDWRLPTVTELEGIVRLCLPGMAAEPCTSIPGPTQLAFYWSSSTANFFFQPDVAWGVLFSGSGGKADAGKSGSAYARAVRTSS